MLQHLRSALQRAFHSRWLYYCWAMLLLAGVYYCVWHLTPPEAAVTIQLGHQASVIFSPDGYKVAEVRDSQPRGRRRRLMPLDTSFYTPVSLWDLASGKKLLELPEEVYSEDAICFSPDSRIIFLDSVGSECRVYDASSGALINTVPDASVRSRTTRGPLFSTDSKRIVLAEISGKHNLQGHPLYNLETLTIEGRLAGAYESIRFSTDNSKIAAIQAIAGTGKYRVRLWGELNTGTIKLLQQVDVVAETITFSPDLKTFASDRKIKDDLTRELSFWSLTTGKVLASVQYDAYAGRSMSLTFASDREELHAKHDAYRGRFLYVLKPNAPEAVSNGAKEHPEPSPVKPRRTYFYSNNIVMVEPDLALKSLTIANQPIRLRLSEWIFGGESDHGYTYISDDDRYVVAYSHWERTKPIPFENWIPAQWLSSFENQWRSLFEKENSCLFILDNQNTKELLAISGFRTWQFTPDNTSVITIDPANRLKLWRLPTSKSWLTLIAATTICWLTLLTIPWLLLKTWRWQFGRKQTKAAVSSGNS